jgi:5S rRNA maturation endonuclease (ribonuclease M5)
MPSVDIEQVLTRLGLEIHNRSGDEITTFCPDHKQFTGRTPSHPKWGLNTTTGKTLCLTEGRGSNLAYTICRVLGCDGNKAIKFLLGTDDEIDIGKLRMDAMMGAQKKLQTHTEMVEKPQVSGLVDIEKGIATRHLTEEAYRFFVHPSGKQYPTNIQKETVDRYKVFHRTWGRYANRIIIPYYLAGKLVGFCAIDILGKERWLQKHPLKSEKDYRKVLYPANFSSDRYLFGIDDCDRCPEYLIIVEGAREVMKLWQEGYKNSVAILGAFLSDEKMKLLTEISPKHIFLMFDGDMAGIEITDRIYEKLERLFKGHIKKCFLPIGKDPKNMNKAELERLLRK